MWPFDTWGENPMLPLFAAARRTAANIPGPGEQGTYTAEDFAEDYPEFYTLRERGTDELLPWDFIDAGVTKNFLVREWEKAKRGEVTPHCRQQCSGCGARKYNGGVCFEGADQI